MALSAPLQRFAVADLPATPWKNGGGSTREVACWPPGAGFDGFDWRVSIATIAASGPFSTFAGVDRVITLLDGDGVRLQGAGIDHRLAEPLAPFAFSGDAAIDCTLLGGASSDFNVMTRRGRLRAELRVLRDSQTLPAAAHGLLLAWQGDWQVNGQALAQGQGLWWADAAHIASVANAEGRAALEPADSAWHVTTEATGAALLAVQWHRTATHA